MKSKHSKYKNTGILFELLTRQLTSDTIAGNKPKSLDILKKYSSGLFVLAHKSSSLKSLKDIIPNDRLFVELRPGMQEPSARKISKKYKKLFW